MSEMLSESFATGINNGFEALSTLDTNHDNKIDNRDSSYNQLRVWVDANHDGITDQGELKTLSELGVVSIGTSHIVTDGEVLEGNNIQAKGTYSLADGQNRLAYSIGFIAEPDGHEWQLDGDGWKMSDEGGFKSFVIGDDAGAKIDATVEGVTNIYGGGGNDELIGNEGSNWLIGAVVCVCGVCDYYVRFLWDRV